MKNVLRLLTLLLVAVFVTSCDKGVKTNSKQVNYIAFQAREEGKWGMMSLDGKVLFKGKFEGSPTAAMNGMFFTRNMDDLVFELWAAEETPRLIGKYRDAGAFTSDLCPVVTKRGVIEYIDKEGEPRITLKKIKGKEVETAFDFFNGMAMIKTEDGYGYINESGEIVVPCEYADAWNFSDDVAIVYTVLGEEDPEESEWSVIDNKGKVLFSKKGTEMWPESYSYYEGLLPVHTSSGRLALIDKTGKTVTRLKASNISSGIYNGMFVYYDEDEEKSGLMNVDGEVVMKPKFDYLQYNGKFIVGTPDYEKYYMYDTNGEKLFKFAGNATIMTPEYKDYDKYILVQDDDETIIVDAEGNEIDSETKIVSYDNNYYWSVNIDFELESYD